MFSLYIVFVGSLVLAAPQPGRIYPVKELVDQESSVLEALEQMGLPKLKQVIEDAEKSSKDIGLLKENFHFFARVMREVEETISATQEHQKICNIVVAVYLLLLLIFNAIVAWRMFIKKNV